MEEQSDVELRGVEVVVELARGAWKQRGRGLHFHDQPAVDYQVQPLPADLHTLVGDRYRELTSDGMPAGE